MGGESTWPGVKRKCGEREGEVWGGGKCGEEGSVERGRGKCGEREGEVWREGGGSVSVATREIDFRIEKHCTSLKKKKALLQVCM